MASLPSEEEVRARGEELGLLAAGAPLDNRTRAAIINRILEERDAPAAAPAVQLVSRTEYPGEAGVIRVDVMFIPTATKGP